MRFVGEVISHQNYLYFTQKTVFFIKLTNFKKTFKY